MTIKNKSLDHGQYGKRHGKPSGICLRVNMYEVEHLNWKVVTAGAAAWTGSAG